MLGDIPSAAQTLVALADRIRTKGDPAAELILLPEGGELKEEHVTPVLKAFARIKRRPLHHRHCESEARKPAAGREGESANRGADRPHSQSESPRSWRRSRFAPSLIDDVVTELRHVDDEFRTLEQLPREQRLKRCQELEAQVDSRARSSADVLPGAGIGRHSPRGEAVS
jgi:hypothetical protein